MAEAIFYFPLTFVRLPKNCSYQTMKEAFREVFDLKKHSRNIWLKGYKINPDILPFLDACAQPALKVWAKAALIEKGVRLPLPAQVITLPQDEDCSSQKISDEARKFFLEGSFFEAGPPIWCS